MSKTGLVMEGGAMRGMFTSGVIDVLMENGIEFDGAIGVSAGATFGCNIKSKQIGRAFRYNTKYCNDDRYGSFKSLLRTGDFFDEKFCYDDIPNRLDLFDTKTFEENPMEFYVVATDLENGKAIYHKCRDGKEKDIEWIRASASLPLASNTVEIGDRKLLDGGIGDSIPIKFFRYKGYDRNVIVLTRPSTYVKTKNKLTPLCAVRYKKYPEFVRAFANRHIRYNKTVEYIRELEANKEVFVIRPESELCIKASETDPNEIKRVYEIGREVATKQLDELRRYLNTNIDTDTNEKGN